jgi:hypothetical protein
LFALTFGDFIMNSFTSNIVILTTETTERDITGTAMTISGIALKYAVANNEVNASIFLPESQLVATGTMRIATELATMGVRITNILAVLSVPSAPAEAPIQESQADTPLNLDPAHLETLKLEDLKAIAKQLGVGATKNKKSLWIEASLATTNPVEAPLEIAVIEEQIAS